MIMLLNARRNLLMQRNPVENAKLIRKIDRQIRALSNGDE
jgi:hypothetical protein